MLKSFKVTNSQGSTLTMPFDDISTGFIVKEIEGLDPVKATLTSSTFATLDGEQYNSSRLETRNIVLHLELKPDYAHGSVKDLRDQLYKFFMPKSKVTFDFNMFDKFTSDIDLQNFDVTIDGRVESFTAPLFTNDPSVDISIICYDPDFSAVASIVASGNTTSGTTTKTITYDGSVDSSLIFKLSPLRSVSSLVITETCPDGTVLSQEFDIAMVSGDILTVSNISGEKSVILTHSAFDTHVLWAMTIDSDWLTLQPGDNVFTVFATGAVIPYTMEYVEKYGGL